MPSIVTHALSYLRDQQHQFVTTCGTSKQLHQFLIPTIINDHRQSGSILRFYFNQLIYPITIFYVHKLNIAMHNSHFPMDELLTGSTVNLIDPKIKKRIYVLDLILRGQVRHFSLIGIRGRTYFPHYRGESPTQKFMDRFLTKTVIENKIRLVTFELRVVTLDSVKDIGRMISLLSSDKSGCRKSLEVLTFSDLEFDLKNGDDNDDPVTTTSSSSYPLVPGMDDEEDLLRFTELRELDITDIVITQPNCRAGFLSFSLLPESLVRLNLTGWKGMSCHPSLPTITIPGEKESSGGEEKQQTAKELDWDCLPKNLIFLALNDIEGDVFRGTRGVPLYQFPTRLETLSISRCDSKSFAGPLQFFEPMTTKPQQQQAQSFPWYLRSRLRHLSFSGMKFLRGSIDLTKLPPNLERFTMSQCQFSCDDKEEAPLTDLSKLPKNLTHLRLGWCGLKGTNLDLTQLPQNLTNLVLTANHFEGTLDFTKLPQNLESLMLGSNKFSGHLDLRQIPKSMVMLEISNNKFTSYEISENVVQRFDGLQPLRIISTGNPFSEVQKDTV
jgi:hypothetical protein